jgi:hypothetical protein
MADCAEPFEIVAGPATVYVAPLGEAFPAINATPAGNWVALGDTEGGVSVEVAQETAELTTDQKSAPLKIIRTGESVTVTFALAEVTLEHFAKLMDDAVVTDTAPGGGTAGHRSFPLKRGLGELRCWAMLIRGNSPYMDANLQYELNKVVMTGSPTWANAKDDKVVLETEWKVLHDPNASNAIGTIRAQDAAPI